MKRLTILCDNNTFIDHYVLGEPALSFFIETNQQKILFDFGYSDVYLKNAKTMGIDLNDVDVCVLSHRHNDHTGGMEYWKGKKVPLICHPDCIGKTVIEGLDVGCPLTIDEIQDKFDLKMTKEPIWITEDCCFLSEIPHTYDFEKRIVIGQKYENDWIEDDFVMEDSALVLKTNKGLWIITACSHAGICNIIHYAKQVANMDTIAGVIGGFHLLEQDERLFKTIETLKTFQIERLIPTHCVNLHSKIEMAKHLTIEEAGSGMMLEIEE